MSWKEIHSSAFGVAKKWHKDPSQRRLDGIWTYQEDLKAPGEEATLNANDSAYS